MYPRRLLCTTGSSYGCMLPGSRDGRIGTNAPLHDKSLQNAKEMSIVIEMMAHEIIEAIGAQGSPRAGDTNDKVSLRRREFHLICCWRFCDKQGWTQQSAI